MLEYMVSRAQQKPGVGRKSTARSYHARMCSSIATPPIAMIVLLLVGATHSSGQIVVIMYRPCRRLHHGCSTPAALDATPCTHFQRNARPSKGMQGTVITAHQLRCDRLGPHTPFRATTSLLQMFRAMQSVVSCRRCSATIMRVSCWTGHAGHFSKQAT